MTWALVAQVLVLIAGASAATWLIGRKPETPRPDRRAIAGTPPRGHRWEFVVNTARCTCGWSWEGALMTTTNWRLRRELRRHLEAVTADGAD